MKENYNAVPVEHYGSSTPLREGNLTFNPTGSIATGVIPADTYTEANNVAQFVKLGTGIFRIDLVQGGNTFIEASANIIHSSSVAGVGARVVALTTVPTNLSASLLIHVRTSGSLVDGPFDSLLVNWKTRQA